MNILTNLNKTISIFLLIKKNMNLFDSFSSIYLFGSILNVNKKSKDIDILLIYLEFSDKMINEINIIRRIIEEMSGLPVDLTVLSIEEEKNIKFLKKINSNHLKLK